MAEWRSTPLPPHHPRHHPRPPRHPLLHLHGRIITVAGVTSSSRVRNADSGTPAGKHLCLQLLPLPNAQRRHLGSAGMAENSRRKGHLPFWSFCGDDTRSKRRRRPSSSRSGSLSAAHMDLLAMRRVNHFALWVFSGRLVMRRYKTSRLWPPSKGRAPTVCRPLGGGGGLFQYLWMRLFRIPLRISSGFNLWGIFWPGSCAALHVPGQAFGN